MIDPVLKDLLYECSGNTALFSKTFVPETVWRPFTAVHEELLSYLDNEGIQFLNVIAFRGFGKSTLIGRIRPLKEICYAYYPYIVYIARSWGNAVEKVEWVKDQIERNDEIKKAFGSMKGKKWPEGEMITTRGVRMIAKGAEQQVRGTLHGDHRPQLILFDDVESTESVRSDEQRDKIREWFLSDVINAPDRGRPFRIMGMNNMLHEDCLTANLADPEKSPEFTSLTIPLCHFVDNKLVSLWPDFLTDDGVEELYKSYERKGKLHTFYREWMCVPTHPDISIFNRKMFKYLDMAAYHRRKRQGYINNIVIIDPAKTVEVHSAHTAIVCIGIDIENGSLYIVDVVDKKMHPDETYYQAFQMAENWNASWIAPEVTSLCDYILFPLKAEAVRRISMGRPPVEIYENLKPQGGEEGKKDNRISSLSSLYNAGIIYHNRAVCDVLEHQLLMHPYSKRKDVADATSYIIQFLEKEMMYTYSMQGNFEDQFDILNQYTLPPLHENWKIA